MSDRSTDRGRASRRPLAVGPVEALGAAIAFGISVEHWGVFEMHYAKQPYVGVLFVVGAAALLYTTVSLVFRPDRWAWVVGALVAAGMFVGGILSRTTGLPGVNFGDWGPPLILSLVLEILFFGVAAAAWSRRR